MEQHSLIQSLLKDPWEAIDGKAGLSLRTVINSFDKVQFIE